MIILNFIALCVVSALLLYFVHMLCQAICRSIELLRQVNTAIVDDGSEGAAIATMLGVQADHRGMLRLTWITMVIMFACAAFLLFVVLMSFFSRTWVCVSGWIGIGLAIVTWLLVRGTHYQADSIRPAFASSKLSVWNIIFGPIYSVRAIKMKCAWLIILVAVVISSIWLVFTA